MMHYNYSYDKMDNILTKSTEHGMYSYTYDELYRLIGAHNPTLEDEAYTYDPVGNRTTAAGIPGEWTYNANNELLGYADISFEYDANGNTIKNVLNSTIADYTYNIENRLSRYEESSDGTVSEYYYDPFGRRLWKDVNGERKYFIFSDEGLIGEYDSFGVELKAYSYKPNASFTTDPLFMKQGSQYYFYSNDHLGTPQKMTAINGENAWQAKHNSFGQAHIDPSNSVANNLRFPGQYQDEETGLHYNYHRYYESETGRFITPDPIGMTGGINLFPYASNNPISWIDPLGLARWKGYLTVTSGGEVYGGGILIGVLNQKITMERKLRS